MIEAWIFLIFCGLICLAAGINKLRKTYRKVCKVDTFKYLQIFDIVSQQLEHAFRDSTLPPNMIDTMAHTRAINEAMKLHRQKQLVPYYKRMKAGAV